MLDANTISTITAAFLWLFPLVTLIGGATLFLSKSKDKLFKENNDSQNTDKFEGIFFAILGIILIGGFVHLVQSSGFSFTAFLPPILGIIIFTLTLIKYFKTKSIIYLGVSLVALVLTGMYFFK